MSIPLVIGHRGASALAPENTLVAFKRAMDDGADGIEFDVRLAADGVPIVIHDADLERTGALKVRVADCTSAELSRIEVGSWFNRKYPTLSETAYSKSTVPMLSDVFESFRNTHATLYVEMKCDPVESDSIARSVVDMVQQFALAENVVVESFDLSAIETVKKLNPSVRTAALFEPSFVKPLLTLRHILELATQSNADELALHHSLVTAKRVAAATARGFKTAIWTVDNPRWISRARRLGIATVITNNPRRMLL